MVRPRLIAKPIARCTCKEIPGRRDQPVPDHDGRSIRRHSARCDRVVEQWNTLARRPGVIPA